ncbi:MAG TPA: VWA domain-containing protein [Candidatus Acidoferrales bacterium]|nr:VWA domain-containing protein [Candidatus Acidoferrales bacterium]
MRKFLAVSARHRQAARSAKFSCLRGIALFIPALFLPLLAFSGGVPAFAARGGPQAQQSEKLPKPQELDKDVYWKRDPATGELNVTFAPPSRQSDSRAVPKSPRGRIIQTTELVRIPCSVFASDGTPLRDLTAKNFRVFDDGAERPIEIFNVGANVPARVALVIDASPSVLPEAEDMKQAAMALVDGLAPTDEVAVVDFSAHTYVQTKFTGVRELLRRAVDRVDVRQLLGDTGGSNIYEAVYLAAHELFRGVQGRKAIVLLTDGQDSGLGLTLDPASIGPRGPQDNRLTFEDVARELEAEGIQVFVVSTETRPRIMTREWFAAHRDATFLTRDARKAGIPAYTLFLAEIVRRSAGELYFLHEADTLAATFSQIAQRVGSEYTLGVAPAWEGNAPRPGWHKLRVETVGLGNAIVIHRMSYYVSPKHSF